MSQNRVREVREKAGLSQQTLAERAGLAIRTVSALENGVVDVRLSTMKAIADVLGVSVTDLIDEPAEASA